jgi:hypothetical protein
MGPTVCLSVGNGTHITGMIWLELSLIDPHKMLLRLCMNHDPDLIQIYTIIIPTVAHKYIKISLYTHSL